MIACCILSSVSGLVIKEGLYNFNFNPEDEQ